jgi:hypothetical protein
VCQISINKCLFLCVLIELSRISGSHGGEYEAGCLLGCSAV